MIFIISCESFRLYKSDHIITIGFESFTNSWQNLLLPENGITLIEWANIIQELLPKDVIEIGFFRVKGKPNKRLLKIRGMEKTNAW